jgi:N-acetylmuramoyl-L-alanine amidase
MADLLKITHAAGHSKYDTPGKQDPEGKKEWEYTNEIVKLVIEELAHYENVAQKRIDDPSGKVDISLNKRVQEINDWGAHVHIDYHLNAYGSGWTSPGGTETYVYSSRPKEALALAQKVQANLVKELGFANRGVKAANFQVLRETRMTAILPEIAFMTNKNEAMKMRTAEYQKKAAKAIVDALVAQYGLKKKPTPKPKQKTSSVLDGVKHDVYVDGKKVVTLDNAQMISTLAKEAIMNGAKKIEIK